MADDGFRGHPPTEADNLREAAFDIVGAAQVVLDDNRVMIMANDSARRMFGLGLNDFGRPIQDLDLSYRPLELRSHLDSLDRDVRPSEIRAVHWRAGDLERIFDVRLTPLTSDGAAMGTSIAYIDVTEAHKLQDQLTGSKRQLEQAYEELQSTVEELETTNEELQSANEELETTNEELQSTNEELETMNEELQSTNEELETMNEELRHRSQELNDVNSFLETILTTIGLAVAVLDRNQRVQIWNGKARELWGLPSDGGRGRTPDGARHRLAGREAAPAGPRHPDRKVSARGSCARGDEPPGKDVHVPRDLPAAGQRWRRQRLRGDHDDGGRPLLSASCEIRWRAALMRTRVVRMR